METGVIGSYLMKSSMSFVTYIDVLVSLIHLSHSLLFLCTLLGFLQFVYIV